MDFTCSQSPVALQYEYGIALQQMPKGLPVSLSMTIRAARVFELIRNLDENVTAPGRPACQDVEFISY